MNTDLISRSELKKAIEQYQIQWNRNCETDIAHWDSCECILAIIDNAPTVFSCNACKNMGNERECVDCHDYSNYAHYEERPQGKWIITAEDNEGIHRIQCPFCRYEKGSDFIDYITVTFEKFPPFCESCGAELKGDAE